MERSVLDPADKKGDYHAGTLKPGLKNEINTSQKLFKSEHIASGLTQLPSQG